MAPCRKNKKNKNGITLVEVLVVLALVGIVTAATVAAFGAWRDKNILELARRDIESVLKLARSKSLASENLKNYGVIFDDVSTNKYQMCSGVTKSEDIPGSGIWHYECLPGEIQNDYSLPPGISFCTPGGSATSLNAELKAYDPGINGDLTKPAVIFGRLEGDYSNIASSTFEGTVYVYNKNKISSGQSPCGDSAKLTSCLADKSCAAITVTAAGSIYGAPVGTTGSQPYDTVFAFVTDFNLDDLRIYNVQDPNNIPPPVVYSGLNSEPISIVISRFGYSYIGYKNSKTITVLDVNDPANPTFAGEITIADYAWDLLIDDDKLYALLNNGLLQIFDLSNPSVPNKIDEINVDPAISSGNAEDMFILGGYAYVTDAVNYKALYVVKIKPLSALSVVYHYDGTGNSSASSKDTRAVHVVEKAGEKFAYLLNSDKDNVVVLDVTPSKIEAAGGIYDGYINSKVINPYGGTFSAIVIEGNYAYVVDKGSNKMMVLDISDPTNILIKHSTTYTVKDSRDIFYFDGKLYTVSFGDDQFIIFDVATDPANPSELARETAGTAPWGVYVTPFPYSAIGTMGGVPAPDAAIGPVPSNGAVNILTNVVPQWTVGSGASSHNIYFGTTAPPQFAGAVSGNSFDPASLNPPLLLNPGTTYYWRVDSVGVGGTTKGGVWTFTTAP